MPTQKNFLTQYVAKNQTKPPYQEADKAWRAFGGTKPLNESLYNAAYRAWHDGTDGRIRVGIPDDL